MRLYRESLYNRPLYSTDYSSVCNRSHATSKLGSKLKRRNDMTNSYEHSSFDVTEDVLFVVLFVLIIAAFILLSN